MSTAADLEALFDHRRDDWDLNDDDRDRPAERTWAEIIRAEVHHLGTGHVNPPGSTVATLLAVERYHEDTLGWRDGFYNVAIDIHTGELYEFRLWGLPSQADLVDTLTVLLVGDGNFDGLSDDAIRTLITVWQLFSASTLRRHRDRAATDCPSDGYSAVVTALNNRTHPLLGAPVDYNPTDLASLTEELAEAALIVDPTNNKPLWNESRPLEPASRSEAAVMIKRAVRAAVAEALAGVPTVEGPPGPAGAPGPTGVAGPKGDIGSTDVNLNLTVSADPSA